MQLVFSGNILEKSSNTNFMKIRPVVAELFHADGRTDRRDEKKNRFSHFFEPKATNAHTNCVILIAFPLQQWMHERASLLRYTYIACLVSFLRT
jgi:hypothetical protein